MARGAAVAAPAGAIRWFSRLGMPLDMQDRQRALDYAKALALDSVAVVGSWGEAEDLTRDAASARGWWEAEEDERRRLMRETGLRLGDALLLETLTTAVEAQSARSFEDAVDAGGDEALARVASGAALMAIHNRALALLAGCGQDHLFVQKYALFAAGRWPLGTRGTTFILF